jgi:hypothetical protein
MRISEIDMENNIGTYGHEAPKIIRAGAGLGVDWHHAVSWCMRESTGLNPEGFTGKFSTRTDWDNGHCRSEAEDTQGVSKSGTAHFSIRSSFAQIHQLLNTTYDLKRSRRDAGSLRKWHCTLWGVTPRASNSLSGTGQSFWTLSNSGPRTPGLITCLVRHSPSVLTPCGENPGILEAAAAPPSPGQSEVSVEPH